MGEELPWNLALGADLTLRPFQWSARGCAVGESERFTSFDGTGIAYERWTGGRGPVLLHHGFAADGRGNWVSPGIVDRFVADGYEVTAIDARGHGRSDAPHDPSAYGEATMARDVSALADHLGYEGFTLIGYSMGGIVSLLAAIAEPRVERLVVGGIGGRVVRGGISRSGVAAALRADDPSTIDDAAGRAFRRFAERSGNDLEALAAQAEAAHLDPIPVDRITVPTLVVVGEDDALARRPEELSGAIPGARLVLVPGDHLGAVGQPAFADAIVSFVEEAG